MYGAKQFLKILDIALDKIFFFKKRFLLEHTKECIEERVEERTERPIEPPLIENPFASGRIIHNRYHTFPFYASHIYDAGQVDTLRRPLRRHRETQEDLNRIELERTRYMTPVERDLYYQERDRREQELLGRGRTSNSLLEGDWLEEDNPFHFTTVRRTESSSKKFPLYHLENIGDLKS
jgi:hypothetical protein